MTPSTLRRTRIGSGIRAALDRATRNESVKVGKHERHGRLDLNARTKYRQEGGTRDGRWKDLNGRYASPPPRGDVFISQDEALGRRSQSREPRKIDETATRTQRGGVTSPATEARGEGRRDADGATASETGKQEARAELLGAPRTPSAKRSGSGKKQFDRIDRSWEKIQHADAAGLGANAPGAADKTDAAAAAAAAANAANTAPKTDADEKHEDGI